MIDREHELPITKQAQVLHVSRGSVYYLPRPVSATDLEVMRRLDRLHLEFPFAGSRMLQGLLVAEGCKIGRRHVKTLMKRMGIEALYRHPRTTKPEPGHKIYPYLLRGMAITRPNQVWAMDITYIPMARGFVYLAVVLDWFSRRVLSWRVSITMEAAFCIETLEDALARFGKPDIFNTDQGSQFTGTAFTGVLIKNAIAISMDGKGAGPVAGLVGIEGGVVSVVINLESPALKRRPGDHAMKNVTSKPELSHSAIETNSHLFDDWFDPIEDMIRGQVRGLIGR
jgi:putative transposase